jgi:hypothetical protein
MQSSTGAERHGLLSQKPRATLPMRAQPACEHPATTVAHLTPADHWHG